MIVKMDFNKQGNRISSNAQLLLMSMRDSGELKKLDTAELDKFALSKPSNDPPLFQKKRGRGRPRKNPIEQQTQSKPADDISLFQQKLGRVRSRKNPVESEIQKNLKKNYILDIKEKLKLLETITNGYREIERIDKETQKNVEKLCAMIHNSK